MGFIENLRQQIMAEGQQRQQLATQQEVESEIQRQKEEREKEFHQQRLRQASTFRQESGVDVLVAELGKLLKETMITGEVISNGYHVPGGLVSRGSSKGDICLYGMYGERIEYRGEAPIAPTDPDSIFDEASWDKKPIKRYVPSRLVHGTEDIMEGKILAIETRPDGNIIFHAGKRVTITEHEWRNNKDILEHALEQVFNNPRVYRFAGDSHPFPPG